MQDPCTNYTRTGNSQIDFIRVRPPSADQAAKKVLKQNAPFGAWKELTHCALAPSLSMTQQALPYSAKDLEAAYRRHDPKLQELQDNVQANLEAKLAVTSSWAGGSC